MSDETQVIEESNELVPVPVTEKKSKKGKGLAAVVAGAAGGIGAIAYDANAEELERLVAPDKSDPASGTTPSDSTHVPQDSVPADNHPAPAPAPAPAPGQPDVMLMPDHIHVLNAPDSMTFEEAFAWAREEKGPAELFEWNGELYHTCHPNEYDQLPAELKTAFESLWLANESVPYSIIGSTEEEVVYDLAIDESTNQLVIEEGVLDEDVVIPGDNWTPEVTDTVTQPDSVNMDNEVYDFTYTEEDFDNNFEGSDEWVNEDDVA